MFISTNSWAPTLEGRDLSHAAAERYLMLQAAGAVPEPGPAAAVLGKLFRRLISIGDERRLAEHEAQPSAASI